MSGLEAKQGGPITVASDVPHGVGKSRLRRNNGWPTWRSCWKKWVVKAAAQKSLAAKNLDSEDRMDTGLDFESNIQSIAKPGNPIHVRVIDPDRSRTDKIDELMVSVASSSGDSVAGHFEETGTYRLVRKRPNNGSQAVAMAST